MKPHLLLKKKLKELVNDPRGFSSIVGTIFMVIVVVILSTNVFLWTLSQNTLYNEAVREKNQLEVDRLNERVKAFNATYTVDATVGKVSVSAKLQNQGPLSVQITNLWVRNINKNFYTFSGPLNVNLQPGGNLSLTGANAINVTIVGSTSEHRFSSWLITGRGNVVPLQEKEIKEIIRADVAAGIGSISMDFEQFGYHVVPNDNDGTALGPRKYDYTIDGTKFIVFAVTLTNWDPSRQDINLTGASYIWATAPWAETLKSDVWRIRRVVNNKLASFSYQILKYNEPTVVYFGATQPKWTRNNVVPVFILLVGRVGTRDYGQNIPFIALRVT